MREQGLSNLHEFVEHVCTEWAMKDLRECTSYKKALRLIKWHKKTLDLHRQQLSPIRNFVFSITKSPTCRLA